MNKNIEYPTLPVSKEECLQYVLYVAMIHVEIIPDISDTLLVNLIGPPENYTPRAKLYAMPKLGTWWQSMPEFGLENVAPEDNAPVNFYFIVKYELSVYPSRVPAGMKRSIPGQWYASGPTEPKQRNGPCCGIVVMMAS